MTPGEILLSKLPAKAVQGWSKEYGGVFLVEHEMAAFICRYISISVYHDIYERYQNDPVAAEDEFFKYAVIYPNTGILSNLYAGIPSSVVNAVLARSGFGNDQSYISEETARLRTEMGKFQYQIPCIIAEAFPQFTIDEIETWPTPKLLKYLSRADFVLQTFRGMQGAGGAQGSESGNVEDFPEIAEQNAFMSGKMKF